MTSGERQRDLASPGEISAGNISDIADFMALIFRGRQAAAGRCYINGVWATEMKAGDEEAACYFIWRRRRPVPAMNVVINAEAASLQALRPGIVLIAGEGMASISAASSTLASRARK